MTFWLLEDEPGDAKGEMSVGDVGLRIALRIQIARESAAILAKANVVFPPPARPPAIEKPKFIYSGVGFTRDIVKETKPNNGPWIRVLERRHPGISTNFSKEQLADPWIFRDCQPTLSSSIWTMTQPTPISNQQRSETRAGESGSFRQPVCSHAASGGFANRPYP